MHNHKKMKKKNITQRFNEIWLSVVLGQKQREFSMNEKNNTKSFLILVWDYLGSIYKGCMRGSVYLSSRAEAFGVKPCGLGPI